MGHKFYSLSFALGDDIPTQSTLMYGILHENVERIAYLAPVFSSFQGLKAACRLPVA